MINDNYNIWREKPDDVCWQSINVADIPIDVLREFKEYIKWTVNYNCEYLNFYKILKFNKNIDMDFVREFISSYREERRFELDEVISILDSRKFRQKYINELLRMWIDWNVENHTEGYY